MTVADVLAQRVRTHLQRFYRTQPRTAALLLTTQYLAAAITFFISILAARLLGPSEYGAAAVVMSYPTLVWSLASFKSVSVTTSSMTKYHADGRQDAVRDLAVFGYSLDLASAGTAWLTVWLTTTLFELGVTPGQSTPLVYAYAGSFVLLAPAGTSLAVLSAMRQFRWLALAQIVGPCVTLLAVFTLLLLGYGAAGLVVGTAVGQAAHGTMMLLMATRVLGRQVGRWWKTSWARQRKCWRELRWSLAWNFSFVSLAGVGSQLPVILLGRYRGPEEAGYFRLAYGVSTAATYVESTLARMAHPSLAVRWTSSPQAFVPTLRRWTLSAGLPAAAALLVAVPILTRMIPALFGSTYAEMVAGTQALVISAAVGALCFWLTPAFYVTDALRWWTIGYAAYVFGVTGIGLAAVHQFGFLGLAIISAIGRALFILSMASYMVRHVAAPRTHTGSHEVAG